MALPVPEKLDGGRAIVIEDVPPGTGIGDLIRAFSPFGAIRLAFVGQPAVVAFETEASAAQALLVASMKGVSLLGTFEEKKLLVPAPAHPAASRNHPSPSSALGASAETEISSSTVLPADAAVPETKTSSRNEDIKAHVGRLQVLIRQMKGQLFFLIKHNILS